MKEKIFILFILIATTSSAQPKSDLYTTVIGIIKDSLRFDTSNFEQLANYNKRLRDAPLKIPAIVINAGITAPDKLNAATMKDVKSILVFQPIEATALLGPDGKFGAIIINGKRSLYRKLFRH